MLRSAVLRFARSYVSGYFLSFAPVAQWIEQLIPNQLAGCPIHPGGTNVYRYPQLLTDCQNRSNCVIFYARNSTKKAQFNLDFVLFSQ